MLKKPTNTFLIALLLLFVAGTLPAQKFLYVHAPSGLNMRESSNTSSKKLATIPLGTKVEFLSDDSFNYITVDNLSGKMIKVKANGKTGYMFSGYLLPYPVPNTDGKVEEYVFKLRNAQVSYTYEEHKYDNDGHVSYHEVFYLNQDDYQGAWVVAQRLFKIPKTMKFPDPNSTKADETIENPKPQTHAWSDEMHIKRDNGKIIYLSYYLRSEGGGWSVNIEPGRKEDYKEEKLRVEYTAVAD